MVTAVGAIEQRPTAAAKGKNQPGEGYRPHLDGLRAVAVYLVVLFHAGLERISGGFIGVDVFFVLSGYLVTQLLMRDLSSRGAIRFGRFYARRMRRLLPASFAALVITAVVYSAVATSTDVSSATNAFKASFLYVANWFFIRRSAGYFSTDVNTLPVVHFWSLAVEEQFYLLWPILLGTLFALTRRFKDNAHRAMQIAVGAGGLASCVWALSLAGSNLNRAYYGTDTRAYELLAGAFIALTPGLVRRASRYRAATVVAFAALAALLILATSLIHINAIQRGVATTIATVALILAMEGARRGPVNRVLSSNLAVYLGKISYGTYLWHWPVIVIALAVADRSISPISLFAISALGGTALASLSYTVLERPIREQRFLNRISPVVLAVGLSVSLVSALLIIPGILDQSQAKAHAGTAQGATDTGFTPIPDLNLATAKTNYGGQLQNVKFLKTWNCEGQPVSTCNIVKGTGEKVLVIGDSHAWMLYPMFAKLAEEQHLSLFTDSTGGCPWQRDLYDTIPVAADSGRLQRCIAYKKDLYERVIPALKPDLIVATESDYLTARPATEFDRNNKPIPAPGPAAHLSQLRADTASSIKLLTASAKKVLIIDPVPVSTQKDDPLRCLERSKVLEACRFVAASHTTLDNLFQSNVDNKRVYVANIDKLLCPYLPICDPVINGVVVRWDSGHITPMFSLSLAAPMTTFLENLGLLKPA
jgi:peptidoglycan/LPS O-acetylase OafA/YrhL